MYLYRFVFTMVIAFATAAFAANMPYDESADAQADLEHALAKANSTTRLVLVIFGANWCEDCRALDVALNSEQNAKLVAKQFEIVKIDVGNFDRNLSVVEQYGDPIGEGIPSAVVLSSDNQVLYVTRMGELANARRMSDVGVYEFFSNVVSQLEVN